MVIPLWIPWTVTIALLLTAFAALLGDSSLPHARPPRWVQRMLWVPGLVALEVQRALGHRASATSIDATPSTSIASSDASDRDKNYYEVRPVAQKDNQEGAGRPVVCVSFQRSSDQYTVLEENTGACSG